MHLDTSLFKTWFLMKPHLLMFWEELVFISDLVYFCKSNYLEKFTEMPFHPHLTSWFSFQSFSAKFKGLGNHLPYLLLWTSGKMWIYYECTSSQLSISVIICGWVFCFTHPKVMTDMLNWQRGAFRINDCLKDPNFSWSTKC